MDETYRYLSSHRLWDSTNPTKSQSVEVVEIWHSHSSAGLHIQHCHIALQETSQWLAQPLTKLGKDGRAYSLLVRLVFAAYNPSDDGLDHLLDHFGLRDARDYAISCIAGIDVLPQAEATRRTFTLTYHPKLAVVWTHSSPVASTAQNLSTSSSTAFTQGIIFASSEQRAALSNLLQRQWDLHLVSHAMFPVFICGLMMDHEVDLTQNKIKVEVRTVEVRTGHHRFASRKENAAAGQMGELSASMSGLCTKLASTARKIQVAREFQDFMNAQVQARLERNGSAPVDNLKKRDESIGEDLLDQNIKLMRKRLEMKLLHNQYILERVRIQLAAVSSMLLAVVEHH